MCGGFVSRRYTRRVGIILDGLFKGCLCFILGGKECAGCLELVE